MPHSHLKGREIYSKLVRNGKEIADIVNNKNFDFNYQYYNFFQNHITFKKVF
jgi:hypothetical protein